MIYYIFRMFIIFLFTIQSKLDYTEKTLANSQA